MSEVDIINHGSPTLAGLKPANMMSVAIESAEECKTKIRDLNRILRSKGLRIVPLRIRENTALLYLYRPRAIQSILMDEEAEKLLLECGYSPCEFCSESSCVRKLISRIEETDGFPHEIGLFLGYPMEDVCGFIDNHGKSYKYSDLWKVYGDVESAKETFRKLRRCKTAYQLQSARGKSIEQLAIRDLI